MVSFIPLIAVFYICTNSSCVSLLPSTLPRLAFRPFSCCLLVLASFLPGYCFLVCCIQAFMQAATSSPLSDFVLLFILLSFFWVSTPRRQVLNTFELHLLGTNTILWQSIEALNKEGVLPTTFSTHHSWSIAT